MKKSLCTIILASLPFITIFTQTNESKSANDRKKYIYIEAGYIYPEGTIRENLSIRQNISYYYADNYSNGYISSFTSGLILGLRYEYYLPKFKSGISSGLRFIGLNTEISGYTSLSSDFFYLRYSMENSETKFARVKSLTENNYVITIPLELRSPSIDYKNLSFFAKAGLEYSIICLRKSANIKFQEESMKVHKDAILEKISGPAGKNYSAFYTSLGLKVGKEDKTNYIMELLLPSLFLTKNNFYMIDAKYFAGFKLSVLVPLEKYN